MNANIHAMNVIAPPAVAPLRNQYSGLSGLNGVYGGDIFSAPKMDRKSDEYATFDLE